MRCRWVHSTVTRLPGAGTGTTGLLVPPVSWAHHWVWIVPALAVLLRNRNDKTALAAYALFVLSPLSSTGASTGGRSRR